MWPMGLLFKVHVLLILKYDQLWVSNDDGKEKHPILNDWIFMRPINELGLHPFRVFLCSGMDPKLLTQKTFF